MVALKLSGLLPVSVEGAVTWKSHPVPVSGTVCGLPVPLSVTVSVPERAPTAVGANVTLIVHVAPAARVVGLIGHAFTPVLVSAKSPEAAMVLIVKGPVPVFFRLTGCAALVVVSIWPLNVKLVGVSPTLGAATPVPVSGTVCGLPAALSVTASVPVRVPSAVGVNVTLIVHVAPAARVAGLIGHALAPVLVSAKSPEAAMVLIVKGPVPVFFRVTGCAALVVCKVWLLKLSVGGVKPTPGGVFDPVPDRFTSNTFVLDRPPFETTAVITRVADSAAATDGVKVTLTVHVAPAPTLGLHASADFAKSVLAAGDTPVTAMLVNVIVEPVLFITVNVCGGVGTPNWSTPKSNGEGETVRDGKSVSSAM